MSVDLLPKSPLTNNLTTVSVIIPVHNAEATIRAAVESALVQRAASMQVIVVDDSSTDRTYEILESTARTESRVKLLRLRGNRGPSFARNAGLRIATGEWAALLDADDFWEVDRLTHLLQNAEGADLVADDIRLLSVRDGTVMDAFYKFKKTQLLTMSDFAGGVLNGSHFDGGYLKPIMRREFLISHGISYDENLRQGEDFILYLSVLAAKGRFRVIPYAGYNYRVGTLRDFSAGNSNSQTVPKLALVAGAVDDLGADCSLSDFERRALGERAKALRETARWIEFRSAVRTRDIQAMTRLSRGNEMMFALRSFRALVKRLGFVR